MAGSGSSGRVALEVEEVGGWDDTGVRVGGGRMSMHLGKTNLA